MGFRFRRSIRLLPGLKLNLGKRGASVSVGVKGAHVTVGPTGTRTTVGVPGTGLSYTELTKPAQTRLDAPPGPTAPSRKGILCAVLLITLIVFVVLRALA